MINRQQPVANLVLEHPEVASIFQRHRIDFCCRGEQSLAHAAAERKLDVDALAGELEQAIAGRNAAPPSDPRALSTEQLLTHIVETHHVPLRTSLPFLQGLAAKVARVHGEKNPKLVALDTAVSDLEASLIPHLDDEEGSLFPLLLTRPHAPEARRDLDNMAQEHLEVSVILERIRDATEEFSVPDWACNSYRTLLRELEAVETDLFTHVHLENHVLKPRFDVAQG